MMEALIKVTANPSKYRLVDLNNPDNVHEDSALFLKLIILETIINTLASTIRLQAKLNQLPEVMKECDDNVSKFNNEVQNILLAFMARGLGEPSGLLMHLFDGYEACTDATFTRYIRTKKDLLTEGTPLTPQQLMSFAVNKFKQMKVDGTWKEASPEQKQIIALMAKLQQAEKLNKELKKKADKPGNQRKKDLKDQKKKNKGNKDDKGGKNKKFKPPRWMIENPHNKAHIMRDGKKYYWCSNHKRFVQHHPDKCTLKEDKEPVQAEEVEPVEPQLKLDPNLVVVINEDDDIDL